MADRNNLCINPYCKNSVTGWGGGSTPTRTDVTGLGFDRQYAARYTSGTFCRTASGTVVIGSQYTVSAYVRSTNNSSGTAYLAWVNSGGSDIGYSTTGYSTTGGTVTRVTVTGTAPSNAVTANLVLDGVNYAFNTTDITQVLLEQAATAGDYFDGDSVGASWDGANGDSSSTLAGGATVTGTASVSLSFGAAASGTRTVLGTVAAQFSSTIVVSGTQIPALFSGTLSVGSRLAGTLTASDLDGTLSATSRLSGTIS